jgi:hypothetical protein
MNKKSTGITGSGGVLGLDKHGSSLGGICFAGSWKMWDVWDFLGTHVSKWFFHLDELMLVNQARSEISVETTALETDRRPCRLTNPSNSVTTM